MQRKADVSMRFRRTITATLVVAGFGALSLLTAQTASAAPAQAPTQPSIPKLVGPLAGNLDAIVAACNQSGGDCFWHG
jgi:hypothetical protein